MNRNIIIGVAVATLTMVGAACGADHDVSGSVGNLPTERVQPIEDDSTVTDIEVWAIDSSWDASVMCDSYANLVDIFGASKAERTFVDAYEQGYGQPLTSRGRSALIRNLDAC